MKKIAIFTLLIIFAVIACNKDSNLYSFYRKTHPLNMRTYKGGEVYSWSAHDSVTKLAAYYLKVDGQITTYGNKIIQYGHCWSASNSKPNLSNVNNMTINYISDMDTNGTNRVAFESRLSNLESKTLYHIRSYIVIGNSEGNAKDTAYNKVTLDTTTLPPIDEWYEQKGGGKPSARYDAVTFNLGDTIFFGTGNEGQGHLQNDFWIYNPVDDSWSQKFSYPTSVYEGVSRAIGFALTYYNVGLREYETRAYIGLGDYRGNDAYQNKSNTLFEYNPQTNIWKAMPDLPGLARSGAVAFVLKDKAYVGTGRYNSNLNDWYVFDPVTYYDATDHRSAWRQISRPGGTSSAGRTGAIAFSVNNRGYFGLGRTDDDQFLKDFWEYDATYDSWQRRLEFPGEGRQNAVGFPIDDQCYVGTGDKIVGDIAFGNSDDVFSDFYRYDPFNNLWFTQNDYTINKDNPIGKKITRAVGFYRISDPVGFIGYGYSMDFVDHQQQDLWYYRP